jgi:4-aminobutyrate aminotransferase/(S)-3-amino-2-methylpropionate transaminase
VDFRSPASRAAQRSWIRPCLPAAAAVAVFEQIENEKLLAEATRIEQTLVAGLEALAARHDIIGEIRGIGAMIAIELVQPGTASTTKEPNPKAVDAIVAYAASKGVLVLNAGTYGNVVRFLPSLAISDALLTDALNVIDEAMATLR